MSDRRHQLPLPALDGTTVEDPYDNYNRHPGKVQSLVDDFPLGTKKDPEETEQAIQRFYYENDQRKKLRAYACKFVTEWGIPDLQGAIEDVWGEFWWDYWNLDEEIGPYQWWEEALAAGVPIPERPYVWHYHPVAFMQQLFEDGYGGDAPTFFIESEGEEVEVEYPSLLKQDGSVEDVIDEGEDVYVREEEGAEVWGLGTGDKHPDFYSEVGVGLSDIDGERRLYDVLIREEVTEGIPDLGESERRIWASIWFSEGGLFANNTWDTGMLSFGPFQQTMGKPPLGGDASERGELQGALGLIPFK